MATKTPSITLLDAAAWIGTALIISSYGLLSLNLISDILVYHFLNFLGSAAVATISYRRKVWQPFVVNIFFTVFAAIALIRSFL